MIAPRTHRPSLVTLAVAVDGGAPPSEFRIFKAGPNETSKGTFTFDDAAARAVMAAYEKHGVGMMIDLEHLSLNPDGVNYDPDARGWARLELRPDGSLWATGVTWTDDGAARLNEKRQRYVSPAFTTDKDGRITEVWNIAICAMPATHGAPALVAANGATMDQKKMAAVLKAMGEDPAKVAKVAKALGLSADASLDEVNAELARFNDLTTKLGELVGTEPAETEEKPAAEKPADAPPPSEPAAEASAVAATALVGRLATLTGKTTPSEIETEVVRLRAAAIELETSKAKLAAEREALESQERDALAVRLARALGPGVAWEDPVHATDPSKRRLAKPFASLSLGDLRAFAARTDGKPAQASAPAAKPAAGNTHGLTPEQLAICSRTGCDPAVFARLNAATAT